MKEEIQRLIRTWVQLEEVQNLEEEKKALVVILMAREEAIRSVEEEFGLKFLDRYVDIK